MVISAKIVYPWGTLYMVDVVVMLVVFGVACRDRKHLVNLSFAHFLVFISDALDYTDLTTYVLLYADT